MHRLAIATAAVRRASLLARGIQATLSSEETMEKQDRSPVTVADFAVQALISLELGRSLPGDPILGEENATFLRSEEGAPLRQRVVEAVLEAGADATEEEILDAIDRCRDESATSPAFWALDPIDGTKGFLRGGHFAVALALVEKGEVTLAVLGCPRLLPWARGKEGAIFTAELGSGTRVQDLAGESSRRARVTSSEDPAEASFLESVEAAHSAHGRHAQVAQRLGVTSPSVRMDSQAKYGALAVGQGSIYLRLPRRADYQEKIWDHAAGSLVVTEAGGTVTDVHGQGLDFSAGPTLANNTGIIATNGSLHDQVIEAVGEVL